jgi:hypothetical protein
MDGSLKLGERIEANYARMLLRVEQREDHLAITVYDTHSKQPNVPVWHGDSYEIEDAKDTALQAARGYHQEQQQRVGGLKQYRTEPLEPVLSVFGGR